jgi:hypothetical protein
MILRTPSTPVLSAALISMMLKSELFKERANILAQVVFPVPAPPQNAYDDRGFEFKCVRRIALACSCPTTSSSVEGLYVAAKFLKD